MVSRDRFARVVFKGAGIYGIAVLLPLYLLETGALPFAGAPIERPEYFYGFLGVALAWQWVFLVIASDVGRYRRLMLPSIVEKLAFGIPVWLLFFGGRVGPDVLAFGTIDFLIGMLFVIAYRGTSRAVASTRTT